jgi:guanylate kinase
MPDIVLSVSLTTRPPRVGEVDGRDYRFVSDAEFERIRGEGGLLEWAKVHDHLYGTPASPCVARMHNGQDVLLDIDVQGTGQIKQRHLDSVGIFLLPPSWEALEERLRSRGTDGSDRIGQRLQSAKEEVRQIGLYDYVVINEEIGRTAETVLAIIRSERQRVSRLRNVTVHLWDSKN